MRLSLDDPRITAYALNELPPDQRSRFKQSLAAHPEGSREIDRVRAFASRLTQELAQEQCPVLPETRSDTILSTARDSVVTPRRAVLNLPFGFWRRWVPVGSLAVVVVVLVFINRTPRTEKLVAEVKPSEQEAITVPDPTPQPGPVTDRPQAAPPATLPMPTNAVPTTEGPRIALDIQLPIPAFMGTPADIPLTEYVETPSDGPRPPFLAPPGTRLISLGKPVTASDANPINGWLELVTDGDKEAGDSSVLELHRRLQWIQIDLQAPHALAAVLIWHAHDTPQIVHDVILQIADDPDFTVHVRTLFNNDYDNSAGLGAGRDKEYFESYEGRLLDARGQVARYVRLYSQGSTYTALNRYTEVEVYGSSAGPLPVGQPTAHAPSLPVTLPPHPNSPASAALEPLAIQLPIPAFMGTPVDLPWLSRPPHQRQFPRTEPPPIASHPHPDPQLPNRRPLTTEAYGRYPEQVFQSPIDHPRSTFAVDVDTASYAVVRRYLTQGQLPPRDAVRIEELVNYFTYCYPEPGGEHPVQLNVAVADCPWQTQHRLARVGVKARSLNLRTRPPANLVFLVDVSGSMSAINKLPLVQQALHLLASQMQAEDRVALVTYAGTAAIALPPTPGIQHLAIRAAIDRLCAGGSTHGSAGIRQAYALAAADFIPGGVNRVILCTDGDFNVGITDRHELTRLIQQQARSGVFLSVLGFGMGNLKDATLEQLADHGNGVYAYVDSFTEAHRLFREQLLGTLCTVAKDVKIQIEFNPATVAQYRLIGYDNRVLPAEHFNDNRKDAGDMGAGQAVTALYEIIPAGLSYPRPLVDALKYQPRLSAPPVIQTANNELMTVKVRYQLPESTPSQLLQWAVSNRECAWRDADPELKFAAGVTAFGLLLKGSPHADGLDWQHVLQWAQAGLDHDPSGYRAEFIRLVHLAAGLSNNPS